MENHEIEFIAYSRKLLRSLESIREQLEAADYEAAKREIDDLICDTEKDIEK